MISVQVIDQGGKVSSIPSSQINFEYIDLGGGFGIPYQNNEKKIDIKNAQEKALRRIARKKKEAAKAVKLKEAAKEEAAKEEVTKENE